eukprot:364762-Chlamydomonas_euryale.AAC.6
MTCVHGNETNGSSRTQSVCKWTAAPRSGRPPAHQTTARAAARRGYRPATQCTLRTAFRTG